MSTSIIASPGSGGTDEPPGMTALSRRPPHTPPASPRRSRNGVPSGTSKFPGRLTCPDTEKHFTPPLFGRPRPMNQSPPLRMIDGTEAKVSVLLIVVGLPYTPYWAGNGGLNRGSPFLPSRDSMSAASSDPAVGGGGRQARPISLHTGLPDRQTRALAPGVIAPGRALDALTAPGSESGVSPIDAAS